MNFEILFIFSMFFNFCTFVIYSLFYSLEKDKYHKLIQDKEEKDRKEREEERRINYEIIKVILMTLKELKTDDNIPELAELITELNYAKQISQSILAEPAA